MTFISPSPGSQEIQSQDVSRFCVWRRPTSWFASGRLLLVSSQKRERGFHVFFSLFFLMELILSWGFHFHELITSQRPTSKYYVIENYGFNIWMLGWHKHPVHESSLLQLNSISTTFTLSNYICQTVPKRVTHLLLSERLVMNQQQPQMTQSLLR